MGSRYSSLRAFIVNDGALMRLNSISIIFITKKSFSAHFLMSFIAHVHLSHSCNLPVMFRCANVSDGENHNVVMSELCVEIQAINSSQRNFDERKKLVQL